MELKEVKNSEYSVGSYWPKGSFLRRVLWYFVNVTFFINPVNPSSILKILLLRLFGAKIGKNVVIKPCVNIKYPWMLAIGDNTWIGEKVWIDNLAEVRIGNNVCISQGAMLLCGNHNYKKETFDLRVDPIVIEDGCWVCAGAIVCPGVRMQSHSILTVRSIATNHLSPYCIYRGNPAVFLRKRIIE